MLGIIPLAIQRAQVLNQITRDGRDFKIWVLIKKLLQVTLYKIDRTIGNCVAA